MTEINSPEPLSKLAKFSPTRLSKTLLCASLAFIALTGNTLAAPNYSAPTAAQMKQALQNSAVSRGASRSGENGVRVDNWIAGMSIEFEDFRKDGCSVASYGAGYFCTYTATTRLRAHSNEGTAAGDRHANAVNVLLGAMMGGSRSHTDTTTRRFIKSGGVWRVSVN
ncbi:MAG: hypothetical protein AAGC77_08325 [Pseudomonadota bacterium]